MAPQSHYMAIVDISRPEGALQAGTISDRTGELRDGKGFAAS